MGRWTPEDPIQDTGLNSNLFQHLLDDPVNMSDPLGLWSLTVTAFNAGCRGYGASVTIGSDESGGFFDIAAGVDVGAGVSFNPTGTVPVRTAFGKPASAWVGFGGHVGAQARPFSAVRSGFLGAALSDNPPSFHYAPQTSPEFGVGSFGLGLYGVGGVRIGAADYDQQGVRWST